MGCLACTTPTKDTKLCTWGLWCTTPTSGTNILTSGLAVHNSKIRDKVTLCDAQLLETLQSYARGDLWCTTHKFGSKLCTWGLWCIIPKEGTKLHKWWLVAHNF